MEVCWQYWITQEGGSKKGMRIWSPGTITQIADGSSALLNQQRKRQLEKASPGSFAALYTWEADAEFGEKAGKQWVIFDPAKFRKHGAGGWRLLVSDVAGPSAPERGCARA